jgi:hypothetical protein
MTRSLYPVTVRREPAAVCVENAVSPAPITFPGPDIVTNAVDAFSTSGPSLYFTTNGAAIVVVFSAFP